MVSAAITFAESFALPSATVPSTVSALVSPAVVPPTTTAKVDAESSDKLPEVPVRGDTVEPGATVPPVEVTGPETPAWSYARVAPACTATALASASLPASRSSVPPVTEVGPVYVLAAPSVFVPEPVKTTPPVPPIVPE